MQKPKLEKEKLLLKDRINNHRNSFIMVIVSFVLLIVTSIYALYDGKTLAGAEIWFFDRINNLPDWLQPIFVLLTNIGTVGAVVIAALIALIAKYRRIGLAILFSGGLGWFIAHILKDLVNRARPGGFLDEAIIRYSTLAGGSGFPSGHATVAAACAMALALIVPKKYSIWLFIFAFLVGVSRVYLGVHLPLDIVSGWCIGIIVGYLVDFGLRVERIESKN